MEIYRTKGHMVACLLVIMEYHQVNSQPHIKTYCPGRTLLEICPSGKVIVFTEALYGTRQGFRTCGGTANPGSGCGQREAGAVLNGQCFGKQTCSVDVDDSTFDPNCRGEPNNYLFTTRICVPEQDTQRLCTASIQRTNRNVGHIFGNSDKVCFLYFDIRPTRSIRLRLTYPPHAGTRIFLCGQVLYFTIRDYSVTAGVICPETPIEELTNRYAKFPTPLTLAVEKEVQDSRNGLLLYYEELPTPASTPVPIKTDITGNPIPPDVPTTTDATTAGGANINSNPGDDNTGNSGSGGGLTNGQTIILASILSVVIIGIVTIIILQIFLIRRRRSKRTDKNSSNQSGRGKDNGEDDNNATNANYEYIDPQETSEGYTALAFPGGRGLN